MQIDKAQGIPTKMTPYTARHLFATKLNNSKNVSLTFIMESLGHSSIQTTRVYLVGFEEDSNKKNHKVLMDGLEWDHFKISIAKAASRSDNIIIRKHIL